MSSSGIFQSLRRLVCFAAIADAGSIQGAAKRLGLSNPVVSTALSELEDELAVKLALRTTRKLKLTQVGKQVHEHAQNMLIAADSALSVGSQASLTGGELRITVPVELGTHWLPDRLLSFYQQYPAIDLQVDSDDSVTALQSSEYDVAIQANYRPPGDKPTNKLVRPTIKLGEINLVCVAAKKPRISWSGDTAIMNSPLIEQEGRGDSLRAYDVKASRSIKLLGNGLIQINNHESALSLVRAGLGVVLVMEDSVKQDLANKTLVKVLPSADFGYLELNLVLRDSLPTPITKAFVEYMQQYDSARINQ